ncbi:MAG: Hpt domain-containing protein [Pseudorhodoplanes sp.]|nr:MAG: Hpt domain-containing protein [Pseudorhodoplanes sp.]
MIELFGGLVDHSPAPPICPVERPIDLEHLFRMTLGDHALEREVLHLFDRQSAILMERICGGEPAVKSAAAHTLKGSARGIGAWAIASAACAVEAAANGDRSDLAAAVSALSAAVGEARAAIRDLLRGH